MFNYFQFFMFNFLFFLYKLFLILIIQSFSSSSLLHRMSHDVFDALCHKMETDYGLQDTEQVQVDESVGMFLYFLSSREKNRRLQERFQHSGETIHRHFYTVLDAMVRMANDYIVPGDQTHIHEKVQGTPFEHAIGAIDGTHVPCVVEASQRIPFIGRKGTPTQNVLAICNWDMLFTYVVAGWEGSMHDARILNTAKTTPHLRFPEPPMGKYYLVDSGYQTTTGFLGPYRGSTYHVPDFYRQLQFNSPNEIFNYNHSKIRCTIERAFGAWKNKWQVLKTMPTFLFDTQVQIVMATMGLHNFIRIENSEDWDCAAAIAGQLYEPADVEEPIPEDFGWAAGSMQDMRDRMRDELVVQYYQGR